MDNKKVDDPERHSVDFLLAEHQYLGDCFWRNEEIGERRVNFFITLVTAAIAALVALATSKEGNLRKDDVYFLTVFALLALLSFGIVTLLRMIHRNTVTDGYKRAMEMIRSRFRDWDDMRLEDYYPFKSGKARKLGTGGLVDMVALVNSVIVTAFCALFAFSYPEWTIWLVALLGLITAWIGIFNYLRNRYDKLTEIFSLGKGKQVQMVALVISLILAALLVALVIRLILAALCALPAHFHPGLGIVLSGLLGFIAALIVQFIYVKWRYEREADGG